MDFLFDNLFISIFVEQWRIETHSFHLLWSEISITLQDVVYHLGLRTEGSTIGFHHFVRRDMMSLDFHLQLDMLTRLGQQNSGRHNSRIQSLHRCIDGLTFDQSVLIAPSSPNLHTCQPVHSATPADLRTQPPTTAKPSARRTSGQYEATTDRLDTAAQHHTAAVETPPPEAPFLATHSSTAAFLATHNTAQHRATQPLIQVIYGASELAYSQGFFNS
nr:uncharacterized protein LOC112735402 [Arachis hypogaea]